MYKKPEGALLGKDAITAVEALEGRELSIPERMVVEEEGYVPMEYKDRKDISTVGVGQTGKFKDMSFGEAYAAHEADARRYIKNYDVLPPEMQGHIMSAMYRGDLKPNYKWVKLFNEGNYGAAAIEFLDHEEYKKELESGERAIAPRLERIYRGIRNYGADLMTYGDLEGNPESLFPSDL